jgi:hypothetical protein
MDFGTCITELEELMEPTSSLATAQVVLVEMHPPLIAMVLGACFTSLPLAIFTWKMYV